MPVTVSFNKPRTDYYDGEPLIIQFSVRSNCFVHLFELDGNKVTVLYPLPGNHKMAVPGKTQTIDAIGNSPLGVGRQPSKFLWVVLLNSNSNLLEESDRKQGSENYGLLNISTDTLMERIDSIAKDDPLKIIHVAMDGPIATKPAPAPEPKSSADSGQQTQTQ